MPQAQPNPAARWRSLLFVPAHVPRFVGRAHERGADAVILDLEDAVPVSEKPAARDTLAEAIASIGRNGGGALVRVNGGLRHMLRDLEAAVVPGLSALVLPKVEEPGVVRAVAEAVAELEAERGLTPGAVRLVLQIESPGALFHLPAIAGAHPRVAAITIGPEDFCASLGAVPDASSLLGPNLSLLCAARAAGIVPLGFVGSIAAYDDLDAFGAMVRHARRLGFRGAMAVHPSQVGPLNDGFAPASEELAWARRVVEAARAAEAEGRGAFVVDGRMADAPVVRRAEDLLALAR